MKKHRRKINLFIIAVFFLTGCYAPKVEEFTGFSEYCQMEDRQKSYFYFAPENIKEKIVKKVSFIFYEGDGPCFDAFLWLEVEDKQEFEDVLSSTLEKVIEWHEKFPLKKWIEVEDLILENYTCLFSEHGGTHAYVEQRESNTIFDGYEKWYNAGYEMIMYSREEKSIIFNRLAYDGLYEDIHIPYLTQYMGVDFTQLEFEYHLSQF